jgi:hypothetical protein
MQFDMKQKQTKERAVVYQAKNGAIELRYDAGRDTLWANINQIAELFGVQKAAISKHLKNIFESGELSKRATVSKMETVRTEGGRSVKRSIEMYNLDSVIAVGYRVNSKRATQFRIWATRVLKEYVTKGYVLDRKRIVANYDAFMKSVGDVQALLPEHISFDPKQVLELIREFADTWVSLDAYDRQTLTTKGVSKKTVRLDAEELLGAIGSLKRELVKKGEATEIFAAERSVGSVEGIIGNVMQSFGGKPVYPTVEEKAAHLLYFMVKNHPFTDGNKRSGAFAFVWFLHRFRAKGSRNVNPAGLTALTLLVAESDPKKKDQVVALITRML